MNYRALSGYTKSPEYVTTNLGTCDNQSRVWRGGHIFSFI